MQTFINIANDLVIICGNIIIFTCMLNFKAQKARNKIIISTVCTALLVAYTLCVYIFDMPLIHATIICFTIPSLILFWSFSKVKDARFFLTFCMVDTMSIIVAFITKFFSVFFDSGAAVITLIVNLILYSLIIGCGYRYFKEYSELLKYQKAGWNTMMVASFIIYIAFYFFAAYPYPLIERLEYTPVYFAFCVVVFSCYVVFFDSIFKTKKLQEQNKELEKEKKFHQIAYMDTLTGLYNRVYYVEKINELERTLEDYENLCCIVMDVNDFKSFNDRFGHHVGDLVLKDSAQKISALFGDLSPYIFRIGGDEFFLLLLNVAEKDVESRLEKLQKEVAHNEHLKDEIFSIASGYFFIQQSDEPKITIEQGFMEADKRMYENKKNYKLSHPEEFLYSASSEN